jgi:hypothetical protein
MDCQEIVGKVTVRLGVAPEVGIVVPNCAVTLHVVALTVPFKVSAPSDAKAFTPTPKIAIDAKARTGKRN